MRLKKILFVNLALILVALLLTEGVLRWQNVEPYVREFPGQHVDGPEVPWARKDTLLGWIPPSEQELEQAYGGDWTINRQGFRGPRDFDELHDSNTTRIVVLGDSFMWGAGIKLDETFPALLQEKFGTSYDVFNLSAPGWGIDQMYLAYEKYKRDLEPDVVILAYIDDDVSRVLEAYRIYEQLNKPVLSVRDGTLTALGPVSRNQLLLNGISQHSVLFSLLLREYYLLYDAYPIVRHIFSEIAQDMTQANGRFIVLRIPTLDNDYLRHRMRRQLSGFPDLSTEMRFQYLDPGARMTGLPDWRQAYYQQDGHMNKAGNLFLLDYVCRHAFEGC